MPSSFDPSRTELVRPSNAPKSKKPLKRPKDRSRFEFGDISVFNA